MVTTGDPIVPKEFETLSPLGLENKLVKILDEWLEEALKGILNIIPEYHRGRVSLKAFTTRNLINDLNTLLHPRRIEEVFKNIVAILFDKGHESLEKELKINIAHNKPFRNIVATQAFGKVQDLSEDIAIKLREDLLEGWQAGEGITELKARVKKVWGDKNLTDARAETIARTESVFAYNGARLQAAKDSSLSLVKKWKATFDSRTAKDSKKLDGQIRSLDDEFYDEVNNKYVSHPPNRPNCRCRIDIIPSSLI